MGRGRRTPSEFAEALLPLTPLSTPLSFQTPALLLLPVVPLSAAVVYSGFITAQTSREMPAMSC
jgi:hypothetical protein